MPSEGWERGVLFSGVSCGPGSFRCWIPENGSAAASGTKHSKKRLRDRWPEGKRIVAGLRERGGRVVATVVPDTGSAALRGNIFDHVEQWRVPLGPILESKPDRILRPRIRTDIPNGTIQRGSGCTP